MSTKPNLNRSVSENQAHPFWKKGFDFCAELFEIENLVEYAAVAILATPLGAAFGMFLSHPVFLIMDTKIGPALPVSLANFFAITFLITSLVVGCVLAFHLLLQLGRLRVTSGRVVGAFFFVALGLYVFNPIDLIAPREDGRSSSEVVDFFVDRLSQMKNKE